MTIEKIENENGVTLKLSGWFDTASAPELDKYMAEIGEPPAIMLDFDEVEYIASAGMRQVLACNKIAKEKGAAFSVINVGKEVMSIFDITKLNRRVKVVGK